jgi:hypothetical protein
MAKFTKTVEVWPLSPSERAALQPGQHITAGGAPGRWCGQTKSGIDVAAWRVNGGSGMISRIRTLRDYAENR